MKWKVFKEIDLQAIALEDKNYQDDHNAPVMKNKDHYFVKWLETLFI